MKLSIVARAGSAFDGEVTEVIAPSVEGEIGILAGHAPLLAILKPGTVRYTLANGQKDSVETGKGFLTVDHDNVMIVVENFPGK